MMHMGNMTKDFVPVGKEEQAEIKNEDNSIKVATLLGKTLFSFSSPHKLIFERRKKHVISFLLKALMLSG